MEEENTGKVVEDTVTVDSETQEVDTKALPSNEKMFTQEEVNNLIRERLDRENKKSQSMKSELDSYKSQISELNKKMLFMNYNIDPNKEEDVIAMFKGKELELNEENLKNMVNSHKEWQKSTIQSLGGEHNVAKKVDNEKEMAMKLFGLKGFVD